MGELSVFMFYCRMEDVKDFGVGNTVLLVVGSDLREIESHAVTCCGNMRDFCGC